MQLNEVKKDPGRHYQLEVRAPQGTRLGLLSVDQSVYLLRNENRLTKDRVSGVALQCYNSSVFLFHWFCFSLRWLIQPSYEEREDYFALRGYSCMGREFSAFKHKIQKCDAQSVTIVKHKQCYFTSVKYKSIY